MSATGDLRSGRALSRPFVVRRDGPTYWTSVTSPIGELTVIGDGRAVTGLYMGPTHRWAPASNPDWRRDPGPFADVITQLGEYFAGRRRVFDVAVAPTGTPWQLAVWAQLTAVTYGTTDSYGALASRLGRPGAARAVGLANGRNPVSIIVPCHRVIGADGRLVGYGGGLDRKRRLLDLESPGTLELWTAPAGPAWRPTDQPLV